MQITAPFHPLPLPQHQDWVWSRSTAGGTNSPVTAIKPLQKKRARVVYYVVFLKYTHGRVPVCGLVIEPSCVLEYSSTCASRHGLCNLRASPGADEELSARVRICDSWRRHSERGDSRPPRVYRRAWRGERNLDDERKMKTCVLVLSECGAARAKPVTGQEESRDGINQSAIGAAEEMTRGHFTLREEIKVGVRVANDGEEDSYGKDIMKLMNKMLYKDFL